MDRIILFLFLSLVPLTFLAKNDMRGSIMDAHGNPVKGVKVSILGLFKTSQTNKTGMFSIKNVMDGDTLVVFPNGKTMAKIPVHPNSTLSITLYERHLVCIDCDKSGCYLYEQAPDVSYQNNIITQRQIRSQNPRNLIEVLRGNVAGLKIYESGSTATASLRGSSSMELSNEPLFIIGNAEYETLDGANNAVSVEDIKEVEIKKDGSEYGMKGANGVIIVRMK